MHGKQEPAEGVKVKFAETIEVLNPERIQRFVTIGME
jgi:hypothetical protein